MSPTESANVLFIKRERRISRKRDQRHICLLIRQIKFKRNVSESHHVHLHRFPTFSDTDRLSYLVGADQLQRKQPRNTYPFGENNSKNERDPRPQRIHRSVHVHLGSRSKNRDGRLKGDEERHGRRQKVKVPVGQDELLRRLLTTAGQRVIDADGEGSDKEQDKY